MRKTLVSRIIILAVVYCVVFLFIVLLQFSDSGNFSISTGGMTIKGRYQAAFKQAHKDDGSLGSGLQPVIGGVRIFYSGLEFFLREDRHNGMRLTDDDGKTVSVSPEYMYNADNISIFILPGGTVLTFRSRDSSEDFELQISGELADNISEITIPIEPRRSSLIRDAGQLSVLYGSSRLVFNTNGQELDKGSISITRNNAFISYHTRRDARIFNPADFIIARESNYDGILRSWQDSSFSQWNQNTSALLNEDDVIAYLAGTIIRGNYASAVSNIPAGFLNSARQSYRSSVYIGGMANAYRSFTASENEKLSLIARLISERSPDFLKEEHILDWLFTRNNTALANDVINFINNMTDETLTLDYCSGLFEIFSDMRQWRPETGNIIERLTRQMLLLISENLDRSIDEDLIFVLGMEGGNIEFSLRLGIALYTWAEAVQNSEWAAIGRSLVLSAISRTAVNTGRLHNILKPSGYYPRAAWLTGDGHWAWTVSQSVRASFIDGDLNISVSFPANMTHHMIVRGIQPFYSIQIHGQAWRSDPQFERYDSSGWIYYQEEQILVLKLRHRTAIEDIRISYRAPAPPLTPDEI